MLAALLSARKNAIGDGGAMAKPLVMLAAQLSARTKPQFAGGDQVLVQERHVSEGFPWRGRGVNRF